mmetsp:Transcript_119718/g.343967  ORF Transcript_119718/g.343967 Transcript_119718/m.343967 type:complete len:229 (+) Transcript_119718:810-1496(+)
MTAGVDEDTGEASVPENLAGDAADCGGCLGWCTDGRDPVAASMAAASLSSTSVGGTAGNRAVWDGRPLCEAPSMSTASPSACFFQPPVFLFGFRLPRFFVDVVPMVDNDCAPCESASRPSGEKSKLFLPEASCASWAAPGTDEARPDAASAASSTVCPVLVLLRDDFFFIFFGPFFFSPDSSPASWASSASMSTFGAPPDSSLCSTSLIGQPPSAWTARSDAEGNGAT